MDVYRKDLFRPDEQEYFEKIEKAMGFKLFIWQKTFILTGHFRQSGKTTAEILRDLVGPKQIIDFRHRQNSMEANFYRRELLKTKERLNSCGIETNPVVRTNQEYYNLLEKTRI